MKRLRTMSTRRLWAVVAVVAALGVTAGIAQAALNGSGPKPPPKPLARAVYDAARAPAVAGISARISFSNGLLPSGSLPEGTTSPLLTGAKGRLWLRSDGRFRLELQADTGDAQVTYDRGRLSIYDATSNTVYRLVVPAGHDGGPRHDAPPTLADVRRGLARLARTWNVSGAQPTSTAGRPSYTVRISPKDDGGLLGAAELAWDADHGVPLRAAVYAQGQSKPVLELEATDISYGAVPASDVATSAPADAKVVDLGSAPAGAHGKPTDVQGMAAVAKRLDFPLSAPRELAGLPRHEVRLARFGDETGAMITYGRGLGAIVVIEHKAGTSGPRSGLDSVRLPQINIDGATGSELSTPLGTLLTYERGGVSYLVAGSVPPLAAENAARGLQ